MDSLRRKAEEEKAFFRSKFKACRQEVEELVVENKKLVNEKQTLNTRLTNLRQLIKQ